MQMVVGCQDYDFRELEQVTVERGSIQYSVASSRKRMYKTVKIRQ